MFVILDGTVDLTLRGSHLDEVGPGGMIGEMAIVDKGPRSATATAKTDGTIVRVDQKRFLYLVQNTPFFAIEVMRTMAERLRKMDAAP
jgi:CRP/FNR family cyclic AMP-dependent transcriptional regulator